MTRTCPLARLALLAPALVVSGCSHVQARPADPAPALRPAFKQERQVPQVAIVSVPAPLPLPGQLKPVPKAEPLSPLGRQPVEPSRRVDSANDAARKQPEKSGWLNAIQQYPYADGALYQVYAAPGQVTDIALQAGEELSSQGPVAAGDTVRWIIGDTISGIGAAKQVHILVKPTRPDIATNLVINTNRRTYHIELKATPATYMAAVSWTYPQDELFAMRRAQARRIEAAPIESGIDLAALDFHYRIDGDRPSWRPLRVFDDGRQAYIEFPASISTDEMPPLFVSGADGSSELVNYRVEGRYMVVDRLFSIAELRLGTNKSQQRVRIERQRAKATRRPS